MSYWISHHTIRKATSLVAGGNSRAEKAARAQLQRRDRYGRFAEMGGGFSFSIRGLGGAAEKMSGRVVGASGTDDIEIEVVGHESIPDGIYALPASKGETVKAILSLDAVEGLPENKALVDQSLAIDVSEITALAQPSGWTPREVADGAPREWVSQDGLITRHYADGYVVYEMDVFDDADTSKEVGRGDSWVDIQKASADFRENGGAQTKPASTTTEVPETSTAPEVEPSKPKNKKDNAEILEKASELGINWEDATIGDSQEQIDSRVSAAVKSLRKMKELGLLDTPEMSDDIKKLVDDYASGKIGIKDLQINIKFTMPTDPELKRWTEGRSQMPMGWRIAVSRQVAVANGDQELVQKIDDFSEFLKTIDSVPDDQLEDLFRQASVQFGQNMGSPIIQTPDVKRIIRGAGGVTVHSSEERKLDDLAGTTGMGESLTIAARRKVETMYGLPFTGENTPEDPEITAMRPISGHSLPKDSYLAREKRMKKMYGEDFVTMYDFPIGSDSADLSETAKYGRSHIVLDDSVNGRTKVVNGDAVARFGSDGAAVTNLDSVDEAGISYADPIGMLYSSMTGDSGASIAGPLDPSFGYSGKYNETATLGTFDPSEVKAVYVADISQTRREIGDVPQGLNPDFYGNLSVIFDFAKTRDEILDSRGTELVAQIGEARGQAGNMGILEYLHPENVELFNSSMTSAWLDRYDTVFGDIPREVLIPPDEPGTTPYEAYLRAKINQFDENGVGTLKENAGTFGETRDGREFGIEVIREELDRAVKARKNREAGGSTSETPKVAETPTAPGAPTEPIEPSQIVESPKPQAAVETLSSTKDDYVTRLDADIAEQKDYISRLTTALDEWNETGVWKGGDYDIVVNPKASPNNMTRDEMIARDYDPDIFAGAVEKRIDELTKEVEGIEKSRQRVDAQPDTTTPIEAILEDEDTLSRISERAREISDMPRSERAEFFRDGEYQYVVHWGADTLEGGVLDPARSRGDEENQSTVGNTRRINKVTSMALVADRDDTKQKLQDITKIQEEFESTGLVDLSSAANPVAMQSTIGALIKTGADRNYAKDKDRAFRPWPDADDLEAMGISEISPEMKGRMSEILEMHRNDTEKKLKRLDPIADKLIESDYQYSSTYPAESLNTANGYGGRYGEGDTWGNDRPGADRTGIHVFRVRLGDDATTDTGGPGEVHIIGEHTPIASLSIETHKNAGPQPTSAQNTWQGWLAEVVENDKKSRAISAPDVADTPDGSSTPDTPNAPESDASDVPEPREPRVVNGVTQRETRLPQGIVPVDDFSEAVEKGLPWSPLLAQSYPPEIQEAIDKIYEITDGRKLLDVFSVGHALDPERRAYDKEELVKIGNEIYQHFASMGVPTDGIDKDSGWTYEGSFIDKVLDADKAGTSYSPAFLMTNALVQRAVSDIRAHHQIESGRTSLEGVMSLAENFNHDRVMTVVPLSAIDSVLGTRRIMSQFEVGESMGYLAPGFRSVLEADQYGYPPNMLPSSRPIYGVSVPERMTAQDFRWSESTYGELRFIMKNDVQSRTTYTMGDSANDNARPAPIGTVAPTSLYDYGGVHAEAQIHGSVSLDDVTEVVVREDAIDPSVMQELRKKVEAAGLMFTVVRIANNDYTSFVDLKVDGAVEVIIAPKNTSTV